MGTPGDKKKLGKVVQDTAQESTEQITTDPTTMGIYSRLSQFEAFSDIRPTITASKPESFQQAHIEDYYTQTKYYPSVSENLQDQPGPSGLQQQKQKKKKCQQTLKKNHSCQFCQKSFVSVDKLSKHQQMHFGQSPFKCEHCKKAFSSKFKLVRHALIHSDCKPFSCTVCERTFHRKDHLKNHIKIHSPIKKIYLCDKSYCKKEYTSLMSYRKHLALHAAEDGSLECQICSSTFETKDEILYHLKIHAGSRTVKNPNEKKFTCDQCDRRFFTKKDVRRHLVVHTGMRDFLCQFCPQRFGRKDHLVRHIKKSHSKHLTSDLETAIKLLPETIVKPEPKIKEELPESSLTLDFPLDVGGILEQESFDDVAPFLNVLPSTSQTGDLSTIFPNIEEEEESNSDELLDTKVVLNDPEIQRLLQPSEEKNLPLPGFSQTFQSPPP